MRRATNQMMPPKTKKSPSPRTTETAPGGKSKKMKYKKPPPRVVRRFLFMAHTEIFRFVFCSLLHIATKNEKESRMRRTHK